MVGAEEQYITYNEFLPALGVQLAPYRGYDPDVNASLSNEFATVGYRAHSMVHGEFELDAGGHVHRRAAAGVPAEGIERRDEGERRRRARVPLDARVRQPGPRRSRSARAGCCRASASERSTRTTSRSTTRCAACCSRSRSRASRSRACDAGRSTRTASCDVSDLGADRHPARPGPRHPELQRPPAGATGSRRVRSFTDITGESTDRLPASDMTVDDPGILDFVALPTTTATRSRSSDADRRTRSRRPPLDARGAAEGDLRRRRQGGRVRRHGVGEARAPERSSARCSSRSGSSSSPRCATATASSTRTIRCSTRSSTSLRRRLQA